MTTYAYHATTGKLSTLTSPAGGLTYSYDGPLQTGETFAGFVAGSVTWNYDSRFQVSNESINGANSITFGYDNDGLLTGAGNLTYTRDSANGLLTAATLGGTATTFTYSNFGELATEETRRGATVLYRGAYTRDNGGRIDTRTETIGGVMAADAYGYDLAGRLTTVTRGAAPLASYSYDANGNRTSVTTSAGTITATYDDQDRILTFGDRTYTHTAHGEVRSWADASGTTTLTYDVQGNLLAVNLPSGNTVEYVVDARNRRIGRKVNGVVTHRWLYQGQLRPIAELNATGAIVTRFIYGARGVTPEYMTRGGVSYRLITDHVGSVRLVINNTSGAIAQRIDYDAWGKVIADTNPGFQPFGFAGGNYDVTTALVRFGVRDYQADIGRWLSKDPIGFFGGDSNLFAYVSSDPGNAIDPEGLSEWGDYANVFEEGLIGAGQGLAASIDGAIPFIDPLEGFGLYDEECFGLGFSKVVGGYSLEVLAGFGALRGLSALSKTQYFKFLNNNRYLRIGPGKMRSYQGDKTPRISIGNGPKAPWNHIDLTFFGR